MCRFGWHVWHPYSTASGQPAFRCVRCDLCRLWDREAQYGKPCWRYFSCEHGIHKNVSLCLYSKNGMKFQVGFCDLCYHNRDKVRAFAKELEEDTGAAVD